MKLIINRRYSGHSYSKKYSRKISPLLNIISSNKNAVHGEVPRHHHQNDDSPAQHHFRLQRTQPLHPHHPQPRHAKKGNRRMVEYSFYGFMTLVQAGTMLVGPRLVNNPEIGNRQEKDLLLDLCHHHCRQLYPHLHVDLRSDPYLHLSHHYQGHQLRQPARTLDFTQSVNIYCNELYEPLVRSKAQMVINMLGRTVMIFFGGVDSILCSGSTEEEFSCYSG